VIRSWNPAASRIFGYEAAEIIGRPVTMLMPQELHFEEPRIVARLARGERIEHFETVRLRKDGSRIDVSLSVSPIKDPHGNIVGAAKIARDMTEAKRLRRAEHDLLTQTQDLAVELEQQLEEGQALQEELELANDELHRSVERAESSQRAAEDARREVANALHLADEARRVAEEANAAKSQFVATMSHELRTPLNAITGYVELIELQIRGPVTPEQSEDLGRIRRSADTLRRLIDDVLRFAKLEAGHLEFRYEQVPLRQFLETLESFIAPRVAQKGLRYHFDPDGADVTVVIDRDKVEQIMLNLLSNAVKFTESGEISLRCRVGKQRFALQVCDTGLGIPETARESIFEPFVQGAQSLTRIADGTGLGLAISRRLARAMDGDVLVESRPGAGSTFCVILPLRR
jgi:PAS domain S-box-containing protein